MNMKNLKYNAFIQLYGLFKIPLLVFIGPRVVEFSDERCEIKIPLGYRTKNHLGSMYFGSLAVGAELSIAAAAVFAIQKSKRKIDFVFKDFKVNFLKRPDGDVHFICMDVVNVSDLVEQAIQSTERVERTFKGYATVPSKSHEPIVEYELTLSMRDRSKK